MIEFGKALFALGWYGGGVIIAISIVYMCYYTTIKEWPTLSTKEKLVFGGFMCAGAAMILGAALLVLGGIIKALQ